MVKPPRRDWETKEELRENLVDQDPTVALALVKALTADTSELPDPLPKELKGFAIPPGGRIVVAIAISQEDYDAIPDISLYDQYMFAIMEEEE